MKPQELGQVGVVTNYPEDFPYIIFDNSDKYIPVAFYAITTNWKTSDL